MHQRKTIVSHINKLVLLIIFLSSSQTFAAFEIRKHTINSGGSIMSNSRFQINVSIAQVDAGDKLQSNRFQLYSGFWTLSINGINTNNFIFKNGFE